VVLRSVIDWVIFLGGVRVWDRSELLYLYLYCIYFISVFLTFLLSAVSVLCHTPRIFAVFCSRRLTI